MTTRSRRIGGSPRPRLLPVERYPYRISTFPNNLTAVSQNKEIQMIVVSNGFSGKTGKDVWIGCSKADVVSKYGPRPELWILPWASRWSTTYVGFHLISRETDWFPGSCFERRNLPGSSHSLLDRMILLLVTGSRTPAGLPLRGQNQKVGRRNPSVLRYLSTNGVGRA